MQQRLEERSRLRALLETVPEAGTDGLRIGCMECAFRILYDIPAKVQIEVAYARAMEYLPRFERRWQQRSEPRRLLGLVDAWLHKNGPNIPPWSEEAELSASGYYEESYDISLTYLVLGCWSAERFPSNTTAYIVHSIADSVQQRETNVWVADDPEAIDAWKRKWELLDTEDDALIEARQRELWTLDRLLKGRGLFENIAASAVWWREWRKVSDHLGELARLYPEVTDPQALEEHVRQWKANSMEYATTSDGA